MGRRKIEIKPIRDDRNRSVTFLKRKGGLFKKAHELSVLCSVDVAVIIFGHNKKLYEYSSSDINEIVGRFQYYGGAHEHKGPQDFADKGGGGDDDDDEDGGDDVGGEEHRGTPQPDHAMMGHPQPGMANHPGFQHVRHGTPHASPPMHNGQMPQFQRGPSPLPPGMSRPSSRNAQHPAQQHIRRTSSNLHLQPPGQPQPHQSPNLQQARPSSSPQPPQHPFASPHMPQPKPLPAHAKSHSIFTPIDDSRSMLAQHWGQSHAEAPRSDPLIKVEDGEPRSASIDVAALQRQNGTPTNGLSPRPPPSVPPPASAAKSPPPPQRTASTPSIPAPQRSASQSKPKLKVQIPSEQSGDEAATAESGQGDESSAPTGNTGSGSGSQQGPSHGVVLPPPSPSASALLSAGAQGPPNPFARPAPPMSTNPHAANREVNSNIETPISALPSRFMSDNLLPSPSTFYPEWGFGRTGDSNMLPSPLNFQTPVAPNGSGWRDEERKRGADEQEGGDPKRTKT
ncbi:uncharacterized protein MYCFIDRAFT_72135 [Pseudocercospora fijiensis CIRAD86]|uniref:MADS-box domain-containing protein n=1 Tax=Pseudocercospora fijiensis (strain CIRAD86) TaxID=383855 RepID=M2ZL36_PSEFD|nr:uncharacterized protein MYCFIDRAFT_72135 [Pseudocercospora fijiensis CIRAD86]EME79764.1 hypothetical protein MYCFIDRAFT_72135 [Pseudocercospora fijiensis CIRAD86]